MEGSGRGRSKGTVGTGTFGDGGRRGSLFARASTNGLEAGVPSAIVRDIPTETDGACDDLHVKTISEFAEIYVERRAYDKKCHANNPNPARHARGTVLGLLEPHTKQR